MKKIIIPFCLLAALILLSFSLPVRVKESRVKIYPAPSGVILSTDYKVSIEGNDVPVYTARVARADQGKKEISETYFDTASFAYFDMTGPISVTVRGRLTKRIIKYVSVNLSNFIVLEFDKW